MKHLPPWADGALFGFLICPLIFALKIFCPPLAVCLADPFLIVMFSPLFLLENLIPKEISLPFEMGMIIIFWSITCAVIAHLLSSLSHVFALDEKSNEEDY